MMENTANPEKKLVPELTAQTISDCLYVRHRIRVSPIHIAEFIKCTTSSQSQSRFVVQHCKLKLLVNVVVVFIVAAQRNQRSDAKTVREENLSHCVDPNLSNNGKAD